MKISPKFIGNITSKLKPLHIDGLIIFSVGLILWVIAADMDLFEQLHDFMESHESWELDEILLAGIIAGLGGFVFGVRRYWEREAELKKRKVAEKRARWLAHHDALTGLGNRRMLDNLLSGSQPGSDGTVPPSVLALDLDGFKGVNDLLGHDGGDELLKTVSRRLKAAFPKDKVFRLGGDEFLILTDGLVPDQDRPHHRLDGLIRALNEPVNVFGVQAEIGASIGASTPVTGTEQLDDLIQQADTALGLAKKQGKNRALFFNPAMNLTRAARAANEAKVRAAIDAKCISAYYQPIMDIPAGRIIGAEVLARWTEKDGANLSPVQLISIAEDTGRILALSDHLLREATSVARTWPADIQVFFNISSIMLADSSLPRRIAGILEETGLSAERLTLEFSENALQDHSSTVAVQLGALAELGLKTALDNFGTGHSNLVQLAGLPIEDYKMDRTFLEQAISDPSGRTAFEAIVAFAGKLNKQLMVVGIETSEHEQQALDLGCTLGQGFHYSPAVSDRTFAGLLSLDSGILSSPEDPSNTAGPVIRAKA